jgi:hypothetical protein
VISTQGVTNEWKMSEKSVEVSDKREDNSTPRLFPRRRRFSPLKNV